MSNNVCGQNKPFSLTCDSVSHVERFVTKTKKVRKNKEKKVLDNKPNRDQTHDETWTEDVFTPYFFLSFFFFFFSPCFY